jgi:transcriptional regulator with XRE-family HTH domain
VTPGNSLPGMASRRAERQAGPVNFSEALRERRTRGRLSQLDLALRAGTTQRHISFLESGRSEPGREMVIRLAESLQLPLRERNGLLATAGFLPAYPQTPLGDPALAPVRAALTHILAGYEPYPAIIIDRQGGLIGMNDAFQKILLDGAAPGLLGPGANAYRLALHPAGMAPRIVNFAQWGRHVLDGLAHELMRHPDEQLSALHAELSSYVPDQPPGPGHLGFAVPLQLRSADGDLRLMTTISSFATAVDVTVAELKLEAFLPADAATAEALLSGRDLRA